MYNPIEVSQASARAREELEKRGTVGRTEPGKVLWQGELEKTGITTESGIDITGKEIAGNIGLTKGSTYVISTDSGTFTGVCKENENGDALYVGNASFVGGDDTGESYIVYADPPEAAVVADLNGGSHCTVATTETIHPIDPKFLPGVCLPVVELSTTVANGATFTDAENAALSEAFNTKLPFVVRANLSFEDTIVEDVVVVSQCYVLEGIRMFGIVLGVSAFDIQEQDGVWKVM